MAQKDAIEGQDKTLVEVGGITVNATISGAYDVTRLGEDLAAVLRNLAQGGSGL